MPRRLFDFGLLLIIHSTYSVLFLGLSDTSQETARRSDMLGDLLKAPKWQPVNTIISGIMWTPTQAFQPSLLL